MPHFVGHHRKAAPLFAGPRRLDGGVQGEQVGLPGNVLDHVGDAGNLVGPAFQGTDTVGDAAHRGRYLLNGLGGLADALGTLGR